MASLVLRNFYHPGLMRWALRFRFPIGRRVVIVGGGFAGLEIADFFANLGRTVTVLEESDELGYGLGPSYLWMYLERLQSLGVALKKNVKIEEINRAGVKAITDGEQKVYEADTVLLATPLEADPNLKQTLCVVGDAAGPGKILEALSTGLKAALQI